MPRQRRNHSSTQVTLRVGLFHVQCHGLFLFHGNRDENSYDSDKHANKPGSRQNGKPLDFAFGEARKHLYLTGASVKLEKQEHGTGNAQSAIPEAGISNFDIDGGNRDPKKSCRDNSDEVGKTTQVADVHPDVYFTTGKGNDGEERCQNTNGGKGDGEDFLFRKLLFFGHGVSPVRCEPLRAAPLFGLVNDFVRLTISQIRSVASSLLESSGRGQPT